MISQEMDCITSSEHFEAGTFNMAVDKMLV